MIGSISKVRPCGHHHYYKYAHVESNTSKVAGNTNNRFYFIERDYVKDIYIDNCWGPFSLHNAKSIYGCSFEDGRFTKFKAHTPNLQSAGEMFTGDNGQTSPAITEIEMNYDKLTGCTSLFYGFRIKDNVALKKLNNTYITPLEENGETLPEEVTSSKNWKLTVQWNGTAGSSTDEVFDDTSLEYATVVLPENYKRCLYLCSDGTQFINTQYVPTNTSGIWSAAKMIGRVIKDTIRVALIS